MPNGCRTKKGTVQKSLGNGSVFGKGTEVALKISQVVLSLHNKETLTLIIEKEIILLFLSNVLYLFCVMSFSSSI